MKIAVLLSGGVDSSMALWRLKEQGFSDIVAYYLKIWLEDDTSYLGACPWEEDLAFAQAVCDQAGVELRVVPLQLEYYDKVVGYALEELRAGRTPSPDIFCNQRIKFGAFFDRLAGADGTGLPPDFKVASGHYARIDCLDGRYRLLRAPDPVKDQTYFLSHLSQAQLSRILFPVGDLVKDEVRSQARRYDLANQDRPDSQGICFLGKIRYPEFVKHYLGEQDGPIVNRESGEELGRHQGFWFHTIGQRTGLGLSGGPWYVSAKDCPRNVVYVSHGSQAAETLRSEFAVEGLNWLSGTAPTADELRAWASVPSEAGDAVGLCLKLRHGPQLIDCELSWSASRPGVLEVRLGRGDRGIAAGQFAVFYRGEECLGSGKIIETEATELADNWARYLARQAAAQVAVQAGLDAKKAKKQARRERYRHHRAGQPTSQDILDRQPGGQA